MRRPGGNQATTGRVAQIKRSGVSGGTLHPGAAGRIKGPPARPSLPEDEPTDCQPTANRHMHDQSSAPAKFASYQEPSRTHSCSALSISPALALPNPRASNTVLAALGHRRAPEAKARAS